MVVNTVIDIGRKRVVPLAPTRQVVQPSSMRPKVMNISKEEMRRHEAIMEARHNAQAVRSDLQSAANALSAANAENDRLARRVKELEAQNARLRKDLEIAENERQVLSNALDSLKIGAVVPKSNPPMEDISAGELHPAPVVPVAVDPALTAVAPADAVPIPSAPIKRKRNRGKKNKIEASAPETAGLAPM